MRRISPKSRTDVTATKIQLLMVLTLMIWPGSLNSIPTTLSERLIQRVAKNA